MSDEYAPPKYAQIVQTLRRRITDGAYPPGSLLPSETQLIKEFGVSRPTVVRALQELQLRGEIDREHGRGSYVKAAAPGTVERQPDRPARTVLDHAEAEESISFVEVGERDAPANIAHLLGLAENAPVTLRRYLVMRGDAASELVSLWASVDLARQVGLNQSEALTVPVRRLVQASTGSRLGHVNERLSARRPTIAEIEALHLVETAPVLGVLASVHDTSGRALLVVDLALPGELHDLEESYPL